MQCYVIIGEKLSAFQIAQRNCPAFTKIIQQLEADEYPKNNFILVEGRLKRQTFGEGRIFYQLCIPPAYRPEILKNCHDDVTSGHLGISRTIQRIKNRFFWPKMARDIYKYVQACPKCQSRKGVCDKPAGYLQCIKVEQPFEKIGIDFLGPFPMSDDGNTMLLCTIDYLTKWIEIQALPDGKAKGVAEFLFKRIFLRHGAPRYIISDRGKCFLAELNQELMRRLGITHRTTSSYHAQCNGLTERLNHTIAMAISMTVEPLKNRNWDKNLEERGKSLM